MHFAETTIVQLTFSSKAKTTDEALHRTFRVDLLIYMYTYIYIWLLYRIVVCINSCSIMEVWYAGWGL